MTTTTRIPATMRVSVLRGIEDLTIEERDVPTPGDGEVLIKVGSVGVCGSDVHYYRHGRIAEHIVKEPMILGHEGGGHIVAVGAGVDPARIGQQVAMEPGIPDRVCDQCKAGRYNLCPNVRFFATPPIDGCFAEFVVLAADFAHPVPDTMSQDAAGLIEPLSVGVWACAKVKVGAGTSVLIAGAGPIGIMNVQVAKALGATEIVVSDIAPARLETALKFGATRILDARLEDPVATGVWVDAFIDCSGAEVAVRSGIRAVKPAGHVALVGMGADDISLPVGLIQGRELNITGTFRYANVYPIAIALASAGAVDLDGMVTGHYSLDEVEGALTADRIPGTMKVVVRPSGVPA